MERMRMRMKSDMHPDTIDPLPNELLPDLPFLFLIHRMHHTRITLRCEAAVTILCFVCHVPCCLDVRDVCCVCMPLQWAKP